MQTHLQRGQVHVLTLNRSLAATNLFGVMNLPLVSGATQASQSNGIGGVSRDSEGQEFVWGVKAASWRKWSMS